MDETGIGNAASSPEYDVALVGGSLAGSTAAILLGQAGQRVALIEKQPDPKAFKRMCSHFIQASAVPTIERLGLMEPIVAAGGVRSRIRARTPWGTIDPPRDNGGYAVNLRRELLDPMVREAAAATPGVDLHLGRTVTALRRNGEVFSGVVVRDPEGEESVLNARLVIGADGRDSRVAKLAEVNEKTHPHGRFAYGSYFEGPPIEGSPDGMIWFNDPNWAAAFPTDGGLTFYAAMPTMDMLPEFKRDPEQALVSYLEALPDPPPIREQHRVDDVLGKIDMTNRVRGPVAPGLALVGDAALATDPLFGVGCGWAFESGEWLADSVIPALRDQESLEKGLKRYRRLHKRKLGGHAFMIHDYATGRPVSGPEKLLFRAAANDPKVAAAFDAFGTRRIGPARMFATAIPRAVLVNTRLSFGRRGEEDPSSSKVAAA
jgi:2-polyprenyl-6-methoxyphenol hydroxylase-like FAD-dependent oxidoreductase